MNGLTNIRKDLINEDKPTEDVEELNLKVNDAPTKRKKKGDREGNNSPCKTLTCMPAYQSCRVARCSLRGHRRGLPTFLIKNLGSVFDRPVHMSFCEDSVKTGPYFFALHGMGIGIYLSSARNYRRREEHGSAKWGVPGTVNRKYADKVKTQNKILTQNVSIGLDGHKHRRNLNVLVCGGSGSGKTRFYAKPNIMNANTSFVGLTRRVKFSGHRQSAAKQGL